MAHFDAIIIGTGQAGPALARRLVAAGRKVAIIERKLFGGTCVNTGCTPTKTLVASAYAAHLARRAADYGVTIGGAVSVDMKAVKARKDAIVGASSKGVERSLKTLKGCTVYEGHARFTGPKEVKVDDEVLEAEQDLHQCGRPRDGAADPRARSGPLSHQQLDDGRRFSSPASDRARRELCRPRICAGLSALRKRGDRHRARAAPDCARGPGCVAGYCRLSCERRASTSASTARLSGWKRQGQRHIGDCRDGGKPSQRSRARICCSRSAGGRTPTISASTRPALPPTRAATSRSTISCAPTCPASGRWGIAMAAAPSPIPPGTISRSSRRICSTTILGASPTASQPMRSIPILRLGAPA